MTMTLTKITAAICTALLIFFLGKWIAGQIYGDAGGHGDEHEQAYVVETEDGDHSAADSTAEETPAEDSSAELAAMIANADLERGAKVFRKCASCHKLEEGGRGTGPHLYGIVGRDVGAVEGFNYSGKMVAVADVWTIENLDAFLTKPKQFAPGTKMSFNGLNKPEDRANLIAYLQTIGN